MKRSGAKTTAVFLLVAVNLVLINMIANTWFFHVDLTEGKIFTLSNASKNVVKNLDDNLTIKVFASKNLSPKLNDVKRFLNDLLSRYDAHGGGNFHYEFIDPGSDEELEKEAQEYRIPPFQENVWNKDKLELKKVYMGAVFLYGDKQEVIPTIQTTAGLEYEITSNIKRMTAQQTLKVGFLQGHGEPSPFEELKSANNELNSNYQVTTIDLSSEEEIPYDISALLILAPLSEIPDEEKLKIDQYLMKGGNIGWFYNKAKTDLQNGVAQRLPLKIDAWTKHYGFQVKDDMVLDLNCGMINIQQRVGFFTMQNQINYPFFPIITKFNPNHPVSNDLEVIACFFPSSIDTTVAPEGVTITPLMYTGEKSMVESGRFNINAQRKFAEAEFDRAFIPLAAALEGKFTSYFAKREIPEDENGEQLISRADLVTESTDAARMLVVGDGNLVRDKYLTNPANVFLLLNTVDWLAGDIELIELRTREVSMRPLKDIPESSKEIWKYFNWFLPPVLVILLGLIYWQVRRNTRKREI